MKTKEKIKLWIWTALGFEVKQDDGTGFNPMPKPASCYLVLPGREVIVAEFVKMPYGQGETLFEGNLVLLLPKGEVMGPGRVFGWRPRTPAENWAQGFDPMQALFDKKE